MKTLLMQLALAGFAASFFSCAFVHDEAELFGKYVSTPKFCTATIVLSPDHSFTQEIVYAGKSEALKTSGKWSFSNSRIDLEGAYPVTDGYGHPATNNNKTGPSWPIVKNRLTGKIILDNDEHYPYTRTSP